MTTIKIVLLIITFALSCISIPSWFIKEENKEDFVNSVKESNRLTDESADNMGNMMVNVLKFLSIVGSGGFIFVLVSLIISLSK